MLHEPITFFNTSRWHSLVTTGLKAHRHAYSYTPLFKPTVPYRGVNKYNKAMKQIWSFFPITTVSQSVCWPGFSCGRGSCINKNIMDFFSSQLVGYIELSNVDTLHRVDVWRHIVLIYITLFVKPSQTFDKLCLSQIFFLQACVFTFSFSEPPNSFSSFSTSCRRIFTVCTRVPHYWNENCQYFFWIMVCTAIIWVNVASNQSLQRLADMAMTICSNLNRVSQCYWSDLSPRH